MVIFYDISTNNILYTELGTLVPTIPLGTVDEKKQILERDGTGFIGVPYEMDLEVFSYKVCLDTVGNFIGLQPK